MRWLLAVLAIPSIARADWPEANPGRPSFSDNAATTATGAFEVEAGLVTADEADTGDAQWTLKYGVTDWLDVRLNLEHTVWGIDPALTGSSLLVKLMLLSPTDHTVGVAVEPYLTFPTVDGPDSWGGGAVLVATNVSHGFQTDANVIVDVATADMQPTAVTITPVVAESHSIVGPLAGYVEGAIDLPAAGDGTTNPYAGVGLAYAVTKFLIVDAAFYVGDDPRTQILAGLTYSMYLPPH